MNTKKDCWLCGRGYGIDNGDLLPGELQRNQFGDMECITCNRLLKNTVILMERPELAKSLGELGKLMEER